MSWSITPERRGENVSVFLCALSSIERKIVSTVLSQPHCLCIILSIALERDSRTNWGFDKVLDLNLKGIFYLTRACVPLLEATVSDPARIINIGSVVGIVPQDAPTHAYDVSKAAVHQLTRKFASEFAPQHITVNCLAPGFVPSRMSAGLKAWGANEDTIASQTPLGRMGGPDDMAGACLYFASRAGSWCTGVILPVDGGAVGAATIPLRSEL
jgi:NAD(P)-dependent dehydrogenase (short-subunit alcohol dehydrogenase family)